MKMAPAAVTETKREETRGPTRWHMEEKGGPAGARCGEGGGGRRPDPTAAVTSGTPRGSRGRVRGPVRVGHCGVVGRQLADVGRSGGNGKWARAKKHSVVFIFTQKNSKRI
jgi:hypothetical protein